MLMDHPHARSTGRDRVGESSRTIIEKKLAFVRLQNAADDVHQRALSCSVLSANDVDFAPAHVEIDARQGLLLPEPLRHAAQLEKRVRAGVLCRLRAHLNGSPVLFLEGAVDDDFALDDFLLGGVNLRFDGRRHERVIIDEPDAIVLQTIDLELAERRLTSFDLLD
jgi:hypothetical protein